MVDSGAAPQLTRRGFLVRCARTGALAAATLGWTRSAWSQAPQAPQASQASQAPRVPARPVPDPGTPDSSNLFAMDQEASRPIRLPPKPGARASMTADARDDLEHHLRCQCGCTLDVYTCRTTDFSCRVSPAMHRDVMSLVEGGYTAEEITEAFVRVYGERVLMAPTKDGFNLLGWLAPFLAVGGGGIALAALLRSWRRRPHAATSASPAAAVSPTRRPVSARPLDATDEELERLRTAVRGDA